MLNTLSIDMKTLNIQDFPQKSQSLSVYLQNTPKTWDIWGDFSEKSGNLPFYMPNINNSNTFVKGKLRIIGIFHNHDNFHNLSAILYVVL